MLLFLTFIKCYSLPLSLPVMTLAFICTCYIQVLVVRKQAAFSICSGMKENRENYPGKKMQQRNRHVCTCTCFSVTLGFYNFHRGAISSAVFAPLLQFLKKVEYGKLHSQKHLSTFQSSLHFFASLDCWRVVVMIRQLGWLCCR